MRRGPCITAQPGRGPPQTFGDTQVTGFAYHPTFMALAFQVLAPEALLAFRTFDRLPRPWRKGLHGALNGVAAFFAVRAIFSRPCPPSAPTHRCGFLGSFSWSAPW